MSNGDDKKKKRSTREAALGATRIGFNDPLTLRTGGSSRPDTLLTPEVEGLATAVRDTTRGTTGGFNRFFTPAKVFDKYVTHALLGLKGGESPVEREKAIYERVLKPGARALYEGTRANLLSFLPPLSPEEGGRKEVPGSEPDPTRGGESSGQVEVPKKAESAQELRNKARIEAMKNDPNMTPRGAPTIAEMEGLGKAVTKFSNVLAVPGFQKMLAQLGMALTAREPTSAAHQLSQAALQNIEGGAEARLASAVRRGVNPGNFDPFLNALTPEAFERVLSQEARTRQLDLEQERIDVAREGQILDAITRIKAAQIAAAPGLKPTEAGPVRDRVLWGLLGVANQTLEASNPQFAQLREVLNVFESAETGVDPNNILLALTKAGLEPLVSNLISRVSRMVETGQISVNDVESITMQELQRMLTEQP